MPQGFVIQHASAQAQSRSESTWMDRWDQCGLAHAVECRSSGQATHYVLKRDAFTQWMPAFDTMDLHLRIGGDNQGQTPAGRDKEVLIGLLGSPVRLYFPSSEELESFLRVRRFLVHAARNTSMDFHTEEVNRPEGLWRYSEETGFILCEGQSLITALQMATQPDRSGKRYAFSCYRATEYVILLAIAQEAQISNPLLYQQLEAQWARSAISSRRFHDIFLQELGTTETPLPLRWYIPGDRVWFRNPDDKSSDVTGYEGSWVIYLGQGLFANFWTAHKPYLLSHKCLEIFHWRHGLCKDDRGELRMDERVVEQCVRETQQNPAKMQDILMRMLKLRDPQGVYESGGCMDATREWPRWITSDACDIHLPVD